MIVIAVGGQRVPLRTLLKTIRGTRSFRAALPGDRGHEPLMLGFAAKRIRSGELLIVVASKNPHYALFAYRRRWSIECLLGDTKTRGLNLEDTRLTNPRNPSLLLAIVAIVIAWSSKSAIAVTGSAPRPRNIHGYPAKSWFRTEFDALRNRLRYDINHAIQPCGLPFHDQAEKGADSCCVVLSSSDGIGIARVQR